MADVPASARSSSRQSQELTEDQIGGVFRDLCEEHVEERRRDDPEAAWRLIEERGRFPSLRVLPEKRGHWPRVMMAVAAALVVVATGFGVFLTQGRSLEYAIEGRGSGGLQASRTSLEEQGELVASEDEPVALSFSDQSRMQLHPFTTLRVQVQGEDRVVTRLAQGGVNVRVEHGPDTDYRFIAGPYEVRVIGTKFRLSYEPEDESLELKLTEGRVSVHDSKGKEYVVEKGETLTLPPQPRAEPSKATDGADSATPALPDSAAPTKEPLRAAQGVPSFGSLASEGRFEDIVAAARRQGIAQVLERKSGDELQELAQAARYTGDTALALRTWKRMHERFSGHTHGINAGFFLGRLAEQSGRSAKAQLWYDSYLNGKPDGVYAAEAMGRKLVLLQAQKGSAAATPLARTYLKRFPDGTYASTAREVLSER